MAELSHKNQAANLSNLNSLLQCAHLKFSNIFSEITLRHDPDTVYMASKYRRRGEKKMAPFRSHYQIEDVREE